MGHSHHFLSRLDRVSLPHVELALHLYREHELLRFILQRVRLPDSAERVALSLDDPTRGPFLVVTREGQFVTCLGEGMTPRNLPVVTRAQLDSIAAKHSELQERLAMCQALVGPGGKTADLLVRIYDAGDTLSREEVVGLLGLQPLLKTTFLRFQAISVENRENARLMLLRALKKTDRLKRVYRPVLEEYWKTFWAATHLSVLNALGCREQLEESGADIEGLRTFFSSCTFQQGIVVSAVRGIWAATRIGKILLPNYKQAYLGAETREQLVEASMVLAALGIRHSKLTAEVRKTLNTTHVFEDNPTTRHLSPLANLLKGIYNKLVFDEPEASTGLQKDLGCQMAVGMTRHRPVGAPFRYTRHEDVPEELALTLAVNNEAQFLSSPTPIQSLFTFLPWLSKAQPEQLYLPRDFLDVIHVPWTPAQTTALLDGFIEDAKEVAELQREALRRQAGPARKGPCPCGSGKKYKRCCGQ